MKLEKNQGIKVLQSGASWHGGSHVWSLPQSQPDGSVTPGAWTPAVKPRLCSSGWHLTTEPARWWGPEGDVRAYLAEWDGTVARAEGEDKFSVERCRLLRELTPDELATCGVFLFGEHEVRDGIAWAYGSSTVTAYDSSKTHAAGRSTATAWSGTTVVTRADEGCIVDRRHGAPKTYLKRKGLDGWHFDGAWVQRRAKK